MSNMTDTDAAILREPLQGGSSTDGLSHGVSSQAISSQSVRGTTDAAGQDRLRLSHLSRITTGRLRRSTLVTLRWTAVAGQALTLVVVSEVLGFSYPYWPAAIIIMTAALLNLGVTFMLPLDRRVGQKEAVLQLGFDTLQLASLLWLTGGMNNPFALLFVAPVVTGATTLSKRVLLSIGALATCASIFLMFNHLPLPWLPAGSFILPPEFTAAIWLALMTGMVFTSVYAWQASREGRRMSEALAATEAVLAQEQKLAALGGLAAAAAHELGTPLATIQLVAKEMARELDQNPDMGPQMLEDAKLLVEQTQRCREILKQLGARGDAGEPMHDTMQLYALLEEASEPYFGLGSHIEIKTYGEGSEPNLRRQAEILYGLKNFIENAVEFAGSRVTLTGAWTLDSVSISIEDDGPGFAPAVRARLGEPYVSVRGDANKVAGGLGLGFFIAKTLIERTGGTVSFDNHPRSGGAFITLNWPLEKIAVEVT